jgi:hypothetical protein
MGLLAINSNISLEKLTISCVNAKSVYMTNGQVDNKITFSVQQYPNIIYNGDPTLNERVAELEAKAVLTNNLNW